MQKRIFLTIVITGIFFVVLLLSSGVLYSVIKKIAHNDGTTISNCKLLPLGAKACGGPNDYLVYSSETTNDIILISMVSLYNFVDGVGNNIFERISTCDITPIPEIELRDNTCQPVSHSRFPL